MLESFQFRRDVEESVTTISMSSSASNDRNPGDGEENAAAGEHEKTMDDLDNAVNGNCGALCSHLTSLQRKVELAVAVDRLVVWDEDPFEMFWNPANLSIPKGAM